MAIFSTTTTHAAPVANSVANASLEERLTFLRKVYALFGGSMIVWMGTALAITKSEAMLGFAISVLPSGFLGLILLIGAMFLLIRLTASAQAPINYLGLALFSILEGFLTAPIIYMALQTTGGAETSLLNPANVVTQAFILTSCVFGGLTTYALTTKKDFSAMKGALWMGFAILFGMAILGFFGVGGSIVSGWGYSLAWVILMGGFVLYDTQNIMRRFPANAAALAACTLLIDFIIMFKHILMLLSRRD